MQQYFSHFETWEDYKAGLYKTSCVDGPQKLSKSIDVLSDQKLFKSQAEMMFIEWPEATKNNLTNMGLNRLAWVGQATCCFSHKAPDFITKQAWWELADRDRDEANSTASEVIEEWCERYDSDSEVLCLKWE
jgi:hypothetical protein